MTSKRIAVVVGLVVVGLGLVFLRTSLEAAGVAQHWFTREHIGMNQALDLLAIACLMMFGGLTFLVLAVRLK